MARDFFDYYLAYTASTEATATFHRWSAIAGIGAVLEKNTCIQFGNSHIYPNHYIMLLGESGTRKSSAIKSFVKIMKGTGYKAFAATKTSKEKFLADLAEYHSGSEEDYDEQIFGEADESSVTPCFIAADEANDFFGINNVEFLSILGNLWDLDGSFENKLKNSKSDIITNPNISILAGNTPTNFAAAFPASIIGQGFFSRLLIIHGERTRPKIAWPTPPTPEATQAIITLLGQIRLAMSGVLEITPRAKQVAGDIYHMTEYGEDDRFKSYFERRHTHLLKLAIVCAAARAQPLIDEEAIIQANTFLTYAQNLMPKALGAFGRAKNSDINQKVLSIIQTAQRPLTLKDIWKQVASDLQSTPELGKILQGLVLAEKIQSTSIGFLPNYGASSLEKLEELGDKVGEYVDYSRYLTPEELGVKST